MVGVENRRRRSREQVVLLIAILLRSAFSRFLVHC